MSYNPYGQAPGTGYPAQQTAHAYPPQNNPGAYPPQAGAYPPQAGAYPPQQGAYPPQQGGYPPQQGAYPPSTQPGGYPPAPGGYPPAGGMPQAGGYPPAAGGAGGAIGFESIAKQPPQPPAQNYGAYPPAAAPGGYGAQPPYGAPAQQPPYGAPQQGAYPPQQGGYGAAPQPGHAPPAAHYQPPAGAPQGYGAPQSGYGQAPPHNQAYQQAHQPAHQQSYHGQPTSTSKVTKQLAGMSIKTHGSVKPYAGFNAESDAQVLRKAMKGLGTDEKAIIGVVGYRTNKQRQDILIAYKQAYGRDLIKDLKSEISGNFERLVVGLMTKPAEYDAYCLHKAMSGAGTDESVLVEILASRSNAEIREIRTVYKRDYKKDLEKELSSETSGHFRRLLVSLNNASRDESNMVDPSKAQQDAQNLYQAGEKKWGTDESAFNLVMASRNYSQLRATFDAYHKIANRDITKSLSSEFSGDILKGMLAVVGVARDPPSYFAHQFQKSMKGLGTSDDDLIRAAVTRSEVDMEEVKQRFTQLFHQPLSKYISDDTGGDYKKLLLAIVGN